MKSHKFKPGETVSLVRSHRAGRMRKGGFEMLRLLPETAGGNQHRVRSKDDGHEWVVMETELA